MQSFPQPLSAKEEKECLIKCREGDQEARNCLIERNLRLVAYIAKKYNMGDKDMDDLISIGTIGLIKGVDSFDESKGIRLATYAARCIENELLMMMRSEKKSARDVYLYDSIGSDKEGNEINLLDIIEYEDEDVAERLTVENHLSHLDGFLKKVLTDREQEIIRMRYGLYGGEEKTQREIAQMFHISRSYVSRIEKKALGKLRKCYEKMEQP
ncbi:MAG: RNA polymerase sporulation sigma factor SigK [Lachnospiraceae bacterium]|nr:RNA polymerase sporulation sigma factor SigK [Lachnospiraceae bacterium]